MCIVIVGTDEIIVTEQAITESDNIEITESSELSDVSVTEIGSEARSIDSSFDNNFHNVPDKREKPLKNIFLGIYKNYKSTYLGNKTSWDYRKKLREHDNNVVTVDLTQQDIKSDIDTESITEKEQNAADIIAELATEQIKSTTAELLNKKRKRKRKDQKLTKSNKRIKVAMPAGGDDPLLAIDNQQYRYNVGPGVNMSLDMYKNIISVKMDDNNLRDILNGRWLKDNSDEGRGKKYDMVTKVLPLFILPFLIQSAIVPFLVTKLKLLLMKSILVGKLAIFLLIISAIKNSNKMLQTYEVAPSYWAGEPSRRSELAAAAATNSAYNGYRVEGKPTTWIN